MKPPIFFGDEIEHDDDDNEARWMRYKKTSYFSAKVFFTGKETKGSVKVYVEAKTPEEAIEKAEEMARKIFKSVSIMITKTTVQKLKRRPK